MERELKKIAADELEDIVTIHISALPNDVLPRMGKKALTNFYWGMYCDKSQHLFGVLLEKKIRGFCLLSIGQIGMGRKFFSFTGLISMALLMFNEPSIFYSGIRQAIYSAPLKNDGAEISFIVVSPSYQGLGIGRLLIDYAVQLCREQKIATIQTKTSNLQLRDFYINEYNAVEINRYSINKRIYSTLKWII